MHPIENIIDASMEQIKKLVDVNTVIGSPVHVDEKTTIIPVSRVGLGFVIGGGEYERWIQVHTLRHAVEDNKERVPTDAASQRRVAHACRRQQRSFVEACDAARFPFDLSHSVPVLLVLDDSDGYRQHQRHYHHSKCTGQRWSDARYGDWSNHVVERTAYCSQVDLLGADAHRTS